MDEKVKDSLIATAFIIFVVLLAFLGCALIGALFLIPEETVPEVPEEPSVPEAPPEEPPPATAVSPEDLERWERITLDNVEDGCLRVAKDEAGASASLVFECTCGETASSDRKSYSCEIDTADPFTDYFANIDCFLEDTACTIETNYGLVTLTFQEMDEWYG